MINLPRPMTLLTLTFLTIVSFLSLCGPLWACGPYHEWTVVGETIEAIAGENALKDCLYPLAAALADTLPRDRGRLCAIEVQIPDSLAEAAARDHLDRKTIETFLGQLFTRANSLKHLSMTPSDFVLDQLAEKNLGVERLFNPTIMEEIARECGVDHFIYIAVDDFKLLTRTSHDSQQALTGIKGRFRIESMVLRAKVVNARDGMIEWIDEISGRYEYSVIFGPKGTKDATADAIPAESETVTADASVASVTAEVSPTADQDHASEAGHSHSALENQTQTGAAQAKEHKVHKLEAQHNIEILEYVSTFGSAPGSQSFITHDGDIVPDELVDRAFEFISSML